MRTFYPRMRWGREKQVHVGRSFPLSSVDDDFLVFNEEVEELTGGFQDKKGEHCWVWLRFVFYRARQGGLLYEKYDGGDENVIL